MKIFALQTDRSAILDQFCHDGECVVHWSYFHWMYFVVGIARYLLITAGLLLVAVIFLSFGTPAGWVIIGFALLWLVLCAAGVAKAYIDWSYDFLLITTDKVILVDQTSVFKQEIKPIHIENIGSVTTFTQFWNLFDFGAIQINLKEGEGGDVITKLFVPKANVVAGQISDVVTRYQRGNRD